MLCLPLFLPSSQLQFFFPFVLSFLVASSPFSQCAENHPSPLLLHLRGLSLSLAQTRYSIQIWWCCRCCCKKGKLETQGRATHIILIGLTLALLATGIALLIAGFTADKKQSEAMQSVPDLIDELVAWPESVLSASVDILGNVSAAYDQVGNIIGTTNYDTVFDAGDLSALDTALPSLNDTVDEITKIADDLDLSSLSEDFSDQGPWLLVKVDIQHGKESRDLLTLLIFFLSLFPPNAVDKYDKQRQQGVRAIFGVLFAFVAIFALLALLDAFGSEDVRRHTHGWMRFCTIPLRSIMFMLCILLWILLALILVLMTVRKRHAKRAIHWA